jgi:16S rRNA C967 or C1407 C5-methylase (RsmB/RsmF family)
MVMDKHYLLSRCLIEWHQKRNSPADRVLHNRLAELNWGPSEREALKNAFFLLIRFWPLVKPQNFDPEKSVSRREFEDQITRLADLNFEELLKRHEQKKPTVEQDLPEHLIQVHGLPAFVVDDWAPWLREAHEYLHASFAEAPVTLRAPLEMSPELKTELSSLGFEKVPFVPGAYSSAEGRLSAGVLKKVFDLGCVIQDAHSQLVGQLLELGEGAKVIDYCAGAGGKTLHLAEQVGPKGRVYAYDVEPKRLAELKKRLRSTGLRNVEVVYDPKQLPKNADGLLIDAPCSGLGILRRQPDRLLRLTSQEVSEFVGVQNDILNKTAALTKGSTQVLYVTCTFNSRENEGHFAESSPVSLKPRLKQLMGQDFDAFLAAQLKAPLPRFKSDAHLYLGPSQASGGLRGDGFFACRLQ